MIVAGRPWRLLGAAALLLVAVLGLSAVIALIGLREPAGVKTVNALTCRQLTAAGEPLEREHQVLLAYSSPKPLARPDIVLSCRFDLNLTADEIRDAALLVPAFTDLIVVKANGLQVQSTDLFLLRNLRFTTLPAFVPLGRGAVRPGLNHFGVELSARVGHTASMGRIYFGPREALRSFYQTGWFIAAGLPTLVIGIQIALALMFSLVWAVRRGETVYGWLAAMLVLAAARGSALVPDFGLVNADFPVWNMLVFWQITAALMFTRAIAGVPMRRSTWLFAAGPSLLWALYLVDAAAFNPTVVTRGGALLIVSYLVLGLWTLLRASMRGNRDALIMLVGGLGLAPFGLHDFLVVLGVQRNYVFLSQASHSVFLMAICTLMTRRFVRAMRESDLTAEALRIRVATAEEELRATYEELRLRREAEAVEIERARLMRDLHDGVGGELASMLALADSPNPPGPEIAGHARAALADMRLIIGSLEDYGGDLALALGAWRERAAPQVRAAGLKLDWKVRDLPALPGMGPAQVLDVLRIVQEGVTNVIKHAHATKLTVAAFETADAVAIAVRDDGPGIDKRTGGNGLRNMTTRAKRLGANLVFGRNGEETELILTIPRSPAPLSSPRRGQDKGQ